jgi:hypothetical protein
MSKNLLASCLEECSTLKARTKIIENRVILMNAFGKSVRRKFTVYHAFL